MIKMSGKSNLKWGICQMRLHEYKNTNLRHELHEFLSIFLVAGSCFSWRHRCVTLLYGIPAGSSKAPYLFNRKGRKVFTQRTQKLSAFFAMHFLCALCG